MNKKIPLTVLLLIALVFSLAACGKEPVDPHEGQVLVNDGFNDVWITPVENVEVSQLTEDDFSVRNEQPVYTGNLFSVRMGIDVSEWNHEIDWQKVADAGVEFALVRVGRRGTTEGGLSEDTTYKVNIDGALSHGIDVGVYFFSQALNVQEAIEEAEYTLTLIEGYSLQLPVYFDWENYDSEMRNSDVEFKTMTDCAVAFCQTIKNAGYEPGVYFGKQQGYYAYDLTRFGDYSWWVVDPGDFYDFYYAGDVWQYSLDTAFVDGIDTETDLNMMFIPLEVPEGAGTEDIAADEAPGN